MVFLSAIIVAPDLWLSFLARLNPEDQKNKTYLSVFACLVGACFIFTIVRAYGFFHVCLKCAERLHDKILPFYKHLSCSLILIQWEES